METKSGIEGYKINDHSIFEFFPELANSWLKDKIVEAFSMDTLVVKYLLLNSGETRNKACRWDAAVAELLHLILH